MKTLILFSSRNGQTREIAAFIADVIRKETDEDSDIINIMRAEILNWSQYDRVLIGASVRYGHFHPMLMKFVRRHKEELQARSSGFFSVNLTARKPEKRSPQTNAYTRKFLLKSPWKPALCAVFAGALRYPHYRWCDRMMIRLIMRMTGGETDVSKEVEYTDWAQVTRFAQEFVRLTQ
ncbi:menaquinone-dependent protoporphyrinogen IX dehydrogenase [Enterobacteriaceae bacterium LUAb1]